MRALQFDRYGEPADVISAAELPLPEPKAGEVRLRLLRSPIHNHDLATIRGTYGVKPALPAVGGSEMLGVVDAAFDDVPVAPGTRVATTVSGAWAEFVIAPASGCVPVPDAIPDERACQLLAMPLSALVLLDDLQVDSGAWILQNAANGAVGRMLIAFARARGVRTINLVRSESAAGGLRANGAEHVVVAQGDAWAANVRDILGGEPLARIVDSVAGPQSFELQRLLGPRGHYVVFGALAAAALRLDPGLMIFNETVVRGFWMTGWMMRASALQRAAAMQKVFAYALSGDLPLPVGGEYAFAQARSALVAAEQPGRAGKILLSP